MRGAGLEVVGVGLVLLSACASPRDAGAQRALAQQPQPLAGKPMVCDVTQPQFGAHGDGKTLDTVAIQKAIDTCGANAAGGVVLLPRPSSGKSTYLSGTLTISKDNLTLQIAAGATLLGAQGGDEVYPRLSPQTDNSQLLNCRKALIYANRVHNLVIEGPGTIDGNGAFPAWGGKALEATRPMAIFIVQSGQTAPGQPEPAACTDVHDGNGAGVGAGAACGGVTLQNLSVVNAGMWSVVFMETDHIHIDKLGVHSPNGPTRDGIDIVDGQHVLIENSTVYSEDDSICMKSGIARGTVDVLVRNSQVLQSSVANGLKLGTATTGLFQDITFENDTVNNVDKSAMAVESVDGADIRNVVYRGITFHKAGTAFFVILGRRGGPGKTGSIEGVTFQDIQGDQMKHPWGSAISGTEAGGTTFAPTDITFDNVKVAYQGAPGPVPATPPEYDGRYPDPNLWGNLPGKGLYVRHVRNLRMLNGSQLTIESGPGSDTQDPRPFVATLDWTGSVPAPLQKP